jgi:hypothetical protein
LHALMRKGIPAQVRVFAMAGLDRRVGGIVVLRGGEYVPGQHAVEAAQTRAVQWRGGEFLGV